jgi:hypothetical protein
MTASELRLIDDAWLASYQALAGVAAVAGAAS